MKNFFLLGCCLLFTGLKAQTFHLTSSLGLAGAAETEATLAPAADLGVEVMIPAGKRFSFFGQAGIQASNYRVETGAIPCFFPFGDKIVSFSNTETYRLRRTEAFLGAGIRYQLGRFGLQTGLRTAWRVHDRITYTDQITLERRRPLQQPVFVAEVKPGEVFQHNDRTELIDYEHAAQLLGVVGISFQLNERLSWGLEYQGSVQSYYLRLLTASYCENCPDLNEPLEERRIEAGIRSLRLRARWRLGQ